MANIVEINENNYVMSKTRDKNLKIDMWINRRSGALLEITEQQLASGWTTAMSEETCARRPFTGFPEAKF
jgi:hypothetical protein